MEISLIWVLWYGADCELDGPDSDFFLGCSRPGKVPSCPCDVRGCVSVTSVGDSSSVLTNGSSILIKDGGMLSSNPTVGGFVSGTEV